MEKRKAEKNIVRDASIVIGLSIGLVFYLLP